MKYLILFLSLFLYQQNFAQNSISLKPSATLGKDAQIWNGNTNGNYGNRSSINLYTWTNGSNTGVKRSYIEFDLSSIPQNAIVTSAQLKLYYDPNTNESFNTHTGSTNFQIRRVTSHWAEDTINWGNQPSASNINVVNVPSHTSGTQNYTIDVATLVNDMIQYGNHGFQLRMQNESSPYRGLLFASSDHPNANLHPELIVSWIDGTFSNKDAMVYSGNTNANYGSHHNLVCYSWSVSSTLRLKRVFIEFDLSHIPLQATLDSAYMNLKFDASPNEGFSTHSGNTAIEIQRVAAAWADSTINWTNQVGVDTMNTVYVPAHSSSQQDYRIDVTNLVDDMMQFGNHGFRIRMQNEQSGNRGLQFASSDHPDITLRPYIELYYSLSTDIEEVSSESTSFQVFPNPSDGIVNIEFQDPNLVRDLRVLDSVGKLVFQSASVSSRLQIDELETGLYFLQVNYNDNSNSEIKKILVY